MENTMVLPQKTKNRVIIEVEVVEWKFCLQEFEREGESQSFSVVYFLFKKFSPEDTFIDEKRER